MPGSPADRPPVGHHGHVSTETEGGDVVKDMELSQHLSESLLVTTSSPLELNEERQGVDSSWNQDGELLVCGQLERRWHLWHEFMKEHSHLDAWLQFAEQAVSCPDLNNFTYITAKEELMKFERLRCEAGCRLVQLDNLTSRNRTLTRLFQGAMHSRLLTLVRVCGQRWDEVNAKLENITGQLKFFVSEWEGFEAEREKLELLLADLDIRLTKVDHLTGDTCEKLRQLQSFQQCVCINSDRVNTLLQRGEALIQHSQANDAHHVENQLLELLQRCSLVHNNIARTHTRLLSMRLVFEDDWILSQAPDSGCPSESLLEEEVALDKTHLDLPVVSNRLKDQHSSVHLPPPPPSPSSPTHEHLGLEWDPSVDIGRSLSQNDADSSYFSAHTGIFQRDSLRRHSYLSSLSDISGDDQEADVNSVQRSDGWPDQTHPRVVPPVETQWARTLNRDQLANSTPNRWDSSRPVNFDGGRVRAWLGVQNPACPEGRSFCSRAVQTDGNYLDESHIDAPIRQQRLDNMPEPFSGLTPSLSLDQESSSDWMKHHHQSNLQAEEETSCREETEYLLSEQRSRTASSTLSPVLLFLLLAAALALLACLIWVALEPPCHRSNRMPRSFHLMLSYVNGPPPT